MGDDWRVRIAFDEDDPAERPESGEQALAAALRSSLGDQVAVTSNGTEIFLYAPAAGSADEAAEVARQVVARHDASASVRTEFWSSLNEGRKYRGTSAFPPGRCGSNCGHTAMW